MTRDDVHKIEKKLNDLKDEYAGIADRIFALAVTGDSAAVEKLYGRWAELPGAIILAEIELHAARFRSCEQAKAAHLAADASGLPGNDAQIDRLTREGGRLRAVLKDFIVAKFGSTSGRPART